MSPVITRARTYTGAGVIAIVLLILIFGNQAYGQWADRNAQGDNAWHLLLRTLSWPRWAVTSDDAATQDVIALDLRAVLLVVFVAALLGMLNSCANGVSVVNIDNGFGGGCMASMINHL